MKSRVITIVLLGGYLFFCSATALKAQRINYNSELIRLFPLADKEWSKNYAESFIFCFNYTIKNTGNFTNYTVIQKTALEAERALYAARKQKMPVQQLKQPESLLSIAQNPSSTLSKSFRQFILQVSGQIDASDSYEQFVKNISALQKSALFKNLSLDEKKMASTLLLTLDYIGQVLPDLIEEAEKKIGKSTALMNKTGNDPSVYFISVGYSSKIEEGWFANWKLITKCALGVVGGGGAGALGGAVAGAAVAGVGAVAGAVIGGVAGAATGASTSCFQ